MDKAESLQKYIFIKTSGISLSPCNECCVRNSFERLVSPGGLDKEEFLARRYLRATLKDRQSN